MSGGNVFQSVPIDKPYHSYFDLSHDHKTTMNMGYLVPILLQECLPSDKFNINSEAMLRFMPMVAPIMHKVDIYIHHFFVPNRIIWKNWEKFISPPAIDTPVQLIPNLHWSTIRSSPGKLLNYLGYPPGDWASGLGEEAYCQALPLYAYQKIWWEYYRDQNLELAEEEFTHYFGDFNGQIEPDQSIRLQELRKRAWEHDYFTSQLPFAQKGQPVEIPIEVTVGVDIPVHYEPAGYAALRQVDGSPYTTSGPLSVDTGFEGPDGTNLVYDPINTLSATGDADEISTTTTINDLRAAYALQKWLEKNARGGTRYTESLLVHFGVRSSDARLQRPEYLGGSRSVMAISEVLQTSESVETPQGNMAGHGISVMSGNGCSYFCEEHGFIMSIMSVRPKTAYYQGLPKIFTKGDRFDYAWKEFSMLGEAEVKNFELFYQNTVPNTNTEVFGYLPRYSEYRYNPSRVTGHIQSDMEYWSLHRSFDEPPTLNYEFINCTPSSRIFAVDPDLTNTHQIVAHIYHKIVARRPLPKYGQPGGLA